MPFTNLDLFIFALTAASLVGTVLNILRRPVGFLVWAATNLGWVWVDTNANLKGQALLMLVYTGTALWGYRKWTADQREAAKKAESAANAEAAPDADPA